MLMATHSEWLYMLHQQQTRISIDPSIDRTTAVCTVAPEAASSASSPRGLTQIANTCAQSSTLDLGAATHRQRPLNTQTICIRLLDENQKKKA